MTPRPATPPAQLLLRLLLGDPRIDPDDLDWSVLLPLAARHRLLLRLMDWFTLRGEIAPDPYLRAAEAARARNRSLLDFIARTGERCGRFGVPHVFLKASWEYPDLGKDVDILVPAGTDPVVFDHATAPARRFRPRAAIRGVTTRAIPGTDVLLDVRLGRLGLLGEHTRFPAKVLERARATALADVACFAPSAEDAILLQALTRLYGRPALRLSDVLTGLTAIQQPLVWDTLVANAREAGLSHGLSLYLEVMDHLHENLLGRPVLGPVVREQLTAGLHARAEFREDRFAFPAVRLTVPLYLRQFVTGITKGDWSGAGRLALLPAFAFTAGYRRLAHPRSGSARA